jgi:D-arabinose 1-dehydrogenase-like Zn-dependent alcohol dehydrogenase
VRRVRVVPRGAARTSASCAEFTGYHADGGFADYAIVDERFA